MARDVTFSNFVKYANTPFMKYILPAIPRGAKLTEQSKITEGHLGKIPGLWKRDQTAWAGFHGWQDYHQYMNATTLQRFQEWQYVAGPEETNFMVVIPVCLNTREYIALDLDTESVERAMWFRERLPWRPPVARPDRL